MSKRDAVLLELRDKLPPAFREPVEGVPFAVYLFVEAARLDGIADRDMLRWLGVRETAFAGAEERWDDLLGDELAKAGSTFDEVYQDLLGDILSLWTRGISPLDSDVEAWIAFQQGALSADDPGEVARRAGLTAGDELRLAKLWRERFAVPEIAARTVAAMSSGKAKSLDIKVSPLVFPPVKGREKALQEAE